MSWKLIGIMHCERHIEIHQQLFLTSEAHGEHAHMLTAKRRHTFPYHKIFHAASGSTSGQANQTHIRHDSIRKLGNSGRCSIAVQ